MRMTLDRLTAQDYETLRRWQAQLLKSDLNPILRRHHDRHGVL
jgi:hypothetical protein